MLQDPPRSLSPDFRHPDSSSQIDFFLRPLPSSLPVALSSALEEVHQLAAAAAAVSEHLAGEASQDTWLPNTSTSLAWWAGLRLHGKIGAL